MPTIVTLKDHEFRDHETERVAIAQGDDWEISDGYLTVYGSEAALATFAPNTWAHVVLTEVTA